MGLMGGFVEKVCRRLKDSVEKDKRGDKAEFRACFGISHIT